MGVCYMGLRLMVEMQIRPSLKPTSWSFGGDGLNAANCCESPCFFSIWKYEKITRAGEDINLN